MRARIYRTLEEDSKIDMTPMLDIVFIMLIFFIVTASFLKESGIPVTTQDTDTPAAADKISLVLYITEDDEVWFGKRRIDMRAIGANLKRQMSEMDNPSVVVRVHNNAKTLTMMEVLDRIRGAGVEDFMVIPTKKM